MSIQYSHESEKFKLPKELSALTGLARSAEESSPYAEVVPIS